MLEIVLEVLDIIVCIALIAAILMQSGKGGGSAGSTFGGGGSSFAGKGNDIDSVMARCTIWLGGAFAVITLALAKLNA